MIGISKFVTSVFKIRKNSRILEILKIRKKIRFISSVLTSKFLNPHNTVVNYTEATIQWEEWAVEDSDSDTREDSEAEGDS